MFLDGIKNLGYKMAYEGGLSFNLDDIIIPKEKERSLHRVTEEVEQITSNYNMGFITDTERYNQVIDTWTHANNETETYVDEADDGSRSRFQCRVHDAGFRCPWFCRPDCTACRYAWFDG
jgi:DNA-directed RNA polymerase subunit beta'